MSVILGIDGGGTNTRAVIERDGVELGRAHGGSIKRLRVGAEVAEANLRNLMKDVYAAAGVTQVDAATVGVASATMPGVMEWITAVLEEFHVAKSEVVGDEVIALDAAFEGGAGILQIAGTGSNTIGRTATGERESAGGWSSTLGDEGSGYWLGLHAIRRSLKAYDQLKPTPVLERAAKLWGTTTLDELVNVGNATPGPDFAALAPVISELAAAGDELCQGLLEQAAQDLAEFVLLVRKKLKERHGLTGEVPVAWTGSVLEKIPTVYARFTELLKAEAPAMPVAASAVIAVEGSLWRARRLAEER